MAKGLFVNKSANTKLQVEHDKLVEIKNVNKTYENAAGKFVALQEVNLDFYKGEFIGVIGKSGSGKSTLLNMITGIDRPSSGEVFVQGTAVHELSENQMAMWRGRNLGIVFQFFQLLPTLSLLENTMLPMDFGKVYPRHERPERAMELLRLVDMEADADKLPAAVSGGQQQRVAIARALANDPPIIVADEPTGNLDSRTAEAVFRMFEGLVSKGKTIMMVTHDATLAKRLSRTVLIADGEIVNEWVYRALPTLSHQQLLEATQKLEVLKYAPGQTIIEQDKPEKHLYIITKGFVEIALKRPTAPDVVVARMGPGEYVGEIEMLKGGNAIASVRAAEAPVEAVALDREVFMKLISESVETREAVEGIVSQRVDENIAARKGK